MMLIFVILTFAASIAVSLLVIVPLAGILVRFRANYNPKGLRLDSEGVVQPPYTGPTVSFLGMFKRVYKIEVGIESCEMGHLLKNVFTGMGGTVQGF
jgi:hypothetical protein